MEGLDEPFFLHARLVEQGSELTSLKLELALLKANVAGLTQRLSPASQDSPEGTPSESNSTDRDAVHGIKYKRLINKWRSFKTVFAGCSTVTGDRI